MWLGLTRGEIQGWIKRRELIRVLPRVYAIGHIFNSFIARQWEAILYAGPNASLTAASGAFHRDLLIYEPRLVHVATPRNVRRAQRGIKVYSERHYNRVMVNGLPVAPTAELLLDLAATDEYKLIRRALATLDFRHALDLGALKAACVKDRPGSRALRRAINTHQPELAHVNGPLEEFFLLWLEDEGFPIPKFNRTRCGVMPDAVYDHLKLVIELDGEGNHHSDAQKRKDAERAAILEAHGYTVIRFTYDDVHHQQAKVRAELIAHGVLPGR